MPLSSAITIWGNEEPISVSVEILSAYKGSNSPDDPSCVETDIFGYDDDGKCYELMDDEMRMAEEAFISVGYV